MFTWENPLFHRRHHIRNHRMSFSNQCLPCSFHPSFHTFDDFCNHVINFEVSCSGNPNDHHVEVLRHLLVFRALFHPTSTDDDSSDGWDLSGTLCEEQLNNLLGYYNRSWCAHRAGSVVQESYPSCAYDLLAGFEISPSAVFSLLSPGIHVEFSFGPQSPSI